jgi:hypothetical protein
MVGSPMATVLSFVAAAGVSASYDDLIGLLVSPATRRQLAHDLLSRWTDERDAAGPRMKAAVVVPPGWSAHAPGLLLRHGGTDLTL